MNCKPPASHLLVDGNSEPQAARLNVMAITNSGIILVRQLCVHGTWEQADSRRRKNQVVVNKPLEGTLVCTQACRNTQNPKRRRGEERI